MKAYVILIVGFCLELITIAPAAFRLIHTQNIHGKAHRDTRFFSTETEISTCSSLHEFCLLTYKVDSLTTTTATAFLYDLI